jgi:serine phosphatase RsbU (regulator of sigma subunit)
MDRSARRFASWVLAIHLIVLGLLIVIVFLASRGMYTKARRQALDQMRARQELLAAQTARGIESFYRSILDDLELQRRAEAATPHGDVLAPLIWEQLRGRATRVFEIDLQTLRVDKDLSDDKKNSATQVIARSGDWFIRLGDKPAVSDLIELDGGGATLAAMPVPSSPPRTIVAVIPTLSIATRYLRDLDQSESIGSMLLDERLRVMSAKQRELVGIDMSQAKVDPRIGVMIDKYISPGLRGTEEFLSSMKLGGVSLEPAVVTVQPVDLPDGKKWWLVVSSELSEVEQFVGQFFRRAIIGSGLVILAMTAILLSTSIQMIRGRLRLERLQAELMTRELAQARNIQLMWLPESQGNKIACDIAAMNRPASHVSGDFYNWFELPDGRAAIVVGDVTGHGLPAAFLMATTQLLVRMTIERVSDPGACLRYVNKQLCQHVFSGQFVTMMLVVIDPKNHVAEIANAGHPPPLIGSGDDFRTLSLEAQLVLAIEPDIPYRTQRIELKPNSSLLLYTDGVTDVQSPTGERLNNSGLEKCLYGRFESAQALLQTVSEAIEQFRAGREPADDLTMVAIQLQPAAAAPEKLDSTPAAATVA